MKRIPGRDQMGPVGRHLRRCTAKSQLCGARSPAFAGSNFPGERITNLPAISRNMPQKSVRTVRSGHRPEFRHQNLWMRADLRVRPGNAKTTGALACR